MFEQQISRLRRALGRDEGQPPSRWLAPFAIVAAGVTAVVALLASRLRGRSSPAQSSPPAQASSPAQSSSPTRAKRASKASPARSGSRRSTAGSRRSGTSGRTRKASGEAGTKPSTARAGGTGEQG